MTSSLLSRLATLALLPAFAIACVVDSSDRGPMSSTSVGSAPPSGTSGGTGATGDGSPSAHPILAQLDTNQTMTAAPGQGVGVFSEYVAGGHWHVWWTCDSLVNPQSTPCAFDVKITVDSGAFTGAAVKDFGTSDTFSPTSSQIAAKTTTTTTAADLIFDTVPGATITIEAAVGGVYDGRFLFFVQNGKVNGGYTGAVTDPLQLVPSSP